MQNQQHLKTDLAPSFSIYSGDTSTITSKAVAKVINEEHLARLHKNDFEEDPFEFSLLSIDEEETDSCGLTLFNLDNDDENDPLGKKLFIGEPVEETSSSSSHSSTESESRRCGTYCMWRPKADGGGLPPGVTKCKKSRSTGSTGSKGWIFRYLLRRSNSEGKQPKLTLLTSKKAESLKHKRNSGERLKAQTPVHEQFYVERRAENESGKRRSYLPYRMNLVGLVGTGKMLPF